MKDKVTQTNEIYEIYSSVARGNPLKGNTVLSFIIIHEEYDIKIVGSTPPIPPD